MKNLKFNANEMLGRAELKNVVGGYVLSEEGESCGLGVLYADGYSYWSCGVPQGEAFDLLGTQYSNLGGSGPAQIVSLCCGAGCGGIC